MLSTLQQTTLFTIIYSWMNLTSEWLVPPLEYFFHRPSIFSLAESTETISIMFLPAMVLCTKLGVCRVKGISLNIQNDCSVIFTERGADERKTADLLLTYQFFPSTQLLQCNPRGRALN